MKYALIALLLSLSTFASVIDMQCDLTTDISIRTPWGLKNFRQPVIKINSITQDNFNAYGSIEDRFGTNMEFFNRLWSQNRRCSEGETCFGTDFSAFRGLSFRVPAESFQRETHRFTMRIRNNTANRTVFANCRTNQY